MRTLHGIDAYPLQWPVGWARTKAPRKGAYKLTLDVALEELLGELRLLGARSCVISSNVPTRRDGLPRSGLSEPADRGVAVYWEGRDGRPMVMACDAWETVRANVRAIGLTISALRSIERSGASQLLERAYTGFAALPASNPRRTWRDVFGIHPSRPISRADVEAMYRTLASVRHPDRGGSHEAMTELNRAREDVLRELGERP